MEPVWQSPPSDRWPPTDPATFGQLRRWVAGDGLPGALTDSGARAFAAAAERHGLAALLDDSLAAQTPTWAPAVSDRLRDAHRTSLATTLRRLDVAGRLLRALDGVGVRVLPLKGAAVATCLYDSPAHRPMADTDVLVLEGWAAAVEALERRGYAISHRGDHAICLLDPLTRDPVELHHSVTSCPGLFPIDRDGLWRRRRPVDGLVPWRPDPADNLLMLALHAAFQHGLALRLGQYLDFRRFFEREALDVTALLARSREVGALPCLVVTLSAAVRLVQARPPDALCFALDEAMSRGQRRLVARVAAAPERWLEGMHPALPRVRWEVSAGRRRRLLLLTVAPPQPEGFLGGIGRWLRAIPRALSLAFALLGPGIGAQRGRGAGPGG